MLRNVWLLWLLAFSASTSAAESPSVWLRIDNAINGPVQVRLGDEGRWVTLGRVLRPANRTAPGFGAGRWAAPGTIAATAVHGIRIRISGGEFGPMISLVPRQFATIPDLYGGHVPGDSGIRTDIGAGETLFREWAPLTGSPVFIETAAAPIPLPTDYVPVAGDVLLIRSRWRDDSPAEVQFENRKSGPVTAVYPDGTREVLGTVSQPLRGVGRFDGTSYTGVGAINTNHPGVITVSTAPFVRSEASEGAPPERRGGFEISPAVHVRDQAGGSPQVMGVAPVAGSEGLEGKYPLFSGALALWPGSGAADGFRVEMQVDGGPWEPLPAMVGRDDAAFSAAGLPKYLGGSDHRTVTKGLTALRILFPRWNQQAADELLAQAVKAQRPSGKEPTGVYTPARGVIALGVKGKVASVVYSLDGEVRAVGNTPGYVWEWDTRNEANGRHWLQVDRTEEDGSVRRGLRRYYVDNG